MQTPPFTVSAPRSSAQFAPFPSSQTVSPGGGRERGQAKLWTVGGCGLASRCRPSVVTCEGKSSAAMVAHAALSRPGSGQRCSLVHRSPGARADGDR